MMKSCTLSHLLPWLNKILEILFVDECIFHIWGIWILSRKKIPHKPTHAIPLIKKGNLLPSSWIWAGFVTFNYENAEEIMLCQFWTYPLMGLAVSTLLSWSPEPLFKTSYYSAGKVGSALLSQLPLQIWEWGHLGDSNFSKTPGQNEASWVAQIRWSRKTA